MVLTVLLFPSVSVTAPWTGRWYNINAEQLTFDIANSIEEYPIKDATKFLFAQYKHGVSKINIKGILTETCDVEGGTIDDKVNNLTIATALWWVNADLKSQCAKISWRGKEYPIMISKFNVTQIAGNKNEFEYTLECIVNEGKY